MGLPDLKVKEISVNLFVQKKSRRGSLPETGVAVVHVPADIVLHAPVFDPNASRVIARKMFKADREAYGFGKGWVPVPDK